MRKAVVWTCEACARSVLRQFERGSTPAALSCGVSEERPEARASAGMILDDFELKVTSCRRASWAQSGGLAAERRPRLFNLLDVLIANRLRQGALLGKN